MRFFKRLGTVILLAAALTACANAKSVAQKPADAGTARSFEAPFATVKDAAYGALKLLKLYPEGEQDTAESHVILLARPPHGMSWGEVGRITVEKSPTPPTMVRVVYDKRTPFQLTGGEEGFSRRLFERMDGLLAKQTSQSD
ncbi:hypothetical protein [Ferrovibrio terrae]|uniref:hypothetical protein n=1 Tax=Ferrovibrio terrae TaxID=2594003 RepID=UPI00313836CA